MSIEIKEIKPSETLEIRQRILWPGKTLEFVKSPNDDEGFHFGLFIANEMVSIISLFYNDKEAQFRKFATLTEHQGKGYGTTLFKYIIKLVQEKEIRRLWCNARGNKTEFYKKFGFNETGEKFEKEGVEFIIMERIF